jgi:hypothetical protein
LNLPHSVLDDSDIVLVVKGVEENSGISYDSELSLCLGHEVIAPLQGCDSRIEGSNHHNFFSIFEKVDFVEIGDCFLDVLGSPEVDLLPLEDNRVGVAQEASAIATLDDHFAPISKVASFLDAQDTSEVHLAARPVFGRGEIIEVILRDELMALFCGSRRVGFVAPTERNVLPEYQQFIGNYFEVLGVRFIDVDGVW